MSTWQVDKLPDFVDTLYILIDMTTKIRKWGNSLAMRIPKIFAQNLNLREGTTIYFEQIGNVLVISTTRPRHTLENMVRFITKKNRHQ